MLLNILNISNITFFVHFSFLRSELDLNWNQLTSLPEQLWHLSCLTYLDLGGNELTRLPEQIGQ